MVDKTIMTAREFLELPETTTPTELIEGEIIVSPAPSLSHQRCVFTGAKYLETLIPDGTVYVAPVDLKFSDITVVQPDIVWVSENSACISIEDKYLQGPPELVVEVLSPGTTHKDRGSKFKSFEQYGLREYWMMEGHESYVEVYARQDDKLMRMGLFESGQTFISPVLGSKQVIVNKLFGLPVESEQ